jgi:hypothetical protein
MDSMSSLSRCETRMRRAQNFRLGAFSPRETAMAVESRIQGFFERTNI